VAIPRLEIIENTREYELITEAHAQISVILNCSRFSLPVCSGGGETAGRGGGMVSSSRGLAGQTIHRERESGAV
jgi:hypothetical protein